MKLQRFALITLLMAVTCHGQINTGKTLWVDATFGNNGTALRQRQDRPFLTCTAAKNAALTGDLIIVRPGSYSDTNLARPSVHWRFEPGAVLANSSTSAALFDDGGNSWSFQVTGHGEFSASRWGTTGGILNLTGATSNVVFEGKSAATSSIGFSGDYSAFRIGNTADTKASIKLQMVTGPFTALRIANACAVRWDVADTWISADDAVFIEATTTGQTDPTLVYLNGRFLDAGAGNSLVNVVNRSLADVEVFVQSQRMIPSSTGYALRFASLDLGVTKLHFNAARVNGNAIVSDNNGSAELDSDITEISNGAWYVTTTDEEYTTLNLKVGVVTNSDTIFRARNDTSGVVQFGKLIRTGSSNLGVPVVECEQDTNLRLIGGVIDGSILTVPALSVTNSGATKLNTVLQDVTVLAGSGVAAINSYGTRTIAAYNCFSNASTLVSGLGAVLTLDVGSFTLDADTR